MLVNGLLNRLFWDVADDLFLHLSTFKHEQGRDAAHSIPRGSSAVVVDVHLADLHSALVVLGQLFHDRSDGAARSAPNRPEVHQDRSLGLENILVEVRIGYFKYSVACHNSPSGRVRSGRAQRNSIKAHRWMGLFNLNTCIGCRAATEVAKPRFQDLSAGIAANTTSGQIKTS